MTTETLTFPSQNLLFPSFEYSNINQISCYYFSLSLPPFWIDVKESQQVRTLDKLKLFKQQFQVGEPFKQILATGKSETFRFPLGHKHRKNKQRLMTPSSACCQILLLSSEIIITTSNLAEIRKQIFFFFLNKQLVKNIDTHRCEIYS